MRTFFTLFLAFLTCMCLTAETHAQQSRPLYDHIWKDRVLLLDAPSAQDTSYQKALREIYARQPGIQERNLVVYRLAEGIDPDSELLSEERLTQLRKAFALGEERFAFVLVGKDSRQKMSGGEPFSLQAVFDKIDAMPMRRAEMMRQQAEDK